MRVLQLLHSLKTGGAEILADRIGRHFAREHTVHFACLDELGEIGEKLVQDGFEVEVLSREEGLDRTCIKRIADLTRRLEIDIIHAHQYTPFFYASASRGFGGTPKIVFTEHGRFHPDTPSAKRGLYNRLMLRKKDNVIAVGNQVKQALVSNEYISKSRIEVIYNGVNLRPFSDVDKNSCRIELRKNLSLKDDAFIISQVARLDYLKDHLTAIQGIAALRDSRATLLLIGEGPERDAIEREIKKLGVNSQVRMLGLRRDIPQLLNGSDALLLTSISEGIPLTLIEGMASKLPIVSTDVGGIPEVITPGVNGILTPAKNPQKLSEALRQLILSPQDCKRLGASGYDIAWRKFSEEQMFSAYDDRLLVN